jgi:hypothetical protein
MATMHVSPRVALYARTINEGYVPSSSAQQSPHVYVPVTSVDHFEQRPCVQQNCPTSCRNLYRDFYAQRQREEALQQKYRQARKALARQSWQEYLFQQNAEHKVSALVDNAERNLERAINIYGGFLRIVYEDLDDAEELVALARAYTSGGGGGGPSDSVSVVPRGAETPEMAQARQKVERSLARSPSRLGAPPSPASAALWKVSPQTVANLRHAQVSAARHNWAHLQDLARFAADLHLREQTYRRALQALGAEPPYPAPLLASVASPAVIDQVSLALRRRGYADASVASGRDHGHGDTADTQALSLLPGPDAAPERGMRRSRFDPMSMDSQHAVAGRDHGTHGYGPTIYKAADTTKIV